MKDPTVTRTKFLPGNEGGLDYPVYLDQVSTEDFLVLTFDTPEDAMISRASFKDYLQRRGLLTKYELLQRKARLYIREEE